MAFTDEVLDQLRFQFKPSVIATNMDSHGLILSRTFTVSAKVKQSKTRPPDFSEERALITLGGGVFTC
jgi:hypothetical protein